MGLLNEDKIQRRREWQRVFENTLYKNDPEFRENKKWRCRLYSKSLRTKREGVKKFYNDVMQSDKDLTVSFE